MPAAFSVADQNSAEPTPMESQERRSRAEQSRINGARSRGPTSELGRQMAALNAIVHGLRARPGILPDEDAEEFDAHVAGVIAELMPASPLQHRLARRVAELSWRLQRVPAIEIDLLLRMSRDDGFPLTGKRGVDDLLTRAIGIEKDAALMRIQRYATTIERSMRSCLRELRDLQGEMATRAEAPKAAVAPPTAPSDGLRFSGSFGASATMAIPVTATPTAPVTSPMASPVKSPVAIATPMQISAEAAAAAILGSFGKKSRAAGNPRPAIPAINEILPHLGKSSAIGAAL